MPYIRANWPFFVYPVKSQNWEFLVKGNLLIFDMRYKSVAKEIGVCPTKNDSSRLKNR